MPQHPTLLGREAVRGLLPAQVLEHLHPGLLDLPRPQELRHHPQEMHIVSQRIQFHHLQV